MDIHRKCDSCFKPGGMRYTYRGIEPYYCPACFKDCLEGDGAISQLAAYLAPLFKAWLEFHDAHTLGDTLRQRASSIELAVAEALQELGMELP